MNNKIRIDFLKALGIVNPCPNDMEFISCIPDSQLLKPLIAKAGKQGVSMKLIAIRYSVSPARVKFIKRRQKK